MSWVGLVIVLVGASLVGLARSGATPLGLVIVAERGRRGTSYLVGVLLVAVGAAVLGV